MPWAPGTLLRSGARNQVRRKRAAFRCTGKRKVGFVAAGFPFIGTVACWALVLDPKTPTILYAGTYGGGVFQSTDGGASWQALTTGLTDAFGQAVGVNSLVLDPTTPATLFAGTQGGVFKYVAVPSATTPSVLPSGIVTTATPTYTWTAAPTGAWYFLWVSDSTARGKITQWYTASQAGCASGTGTCSVTPPIALAAGAAQWWVQPWNADGYGPWGDGMGFMVNP